MGATNSTLHYQLSQFISTDKPAWLQDYNGDMQKIDNGINGALVAAESAQNSADTANAGVGTVGDAVTALQTTVAGHSSDITDLSGDVNTIESLIGNGTPTTTDQTIIGAINEINSGLSQVTTNLDGLKFKKISKTVTIAANTTTEVTFPNMPATTTAILAATLKTALLNYNLPYHNKLNTSQTTWVEVFTPSTGKVNVYNTTSAWADYTLELVVAYTHLPYQ